MKISKKISTKQAPVLSSSLVQDKTSGQSDKPNLLSSNNNKKKKFPADEISILKFALPAIIENFLQMLVGFSDTFLVAHIGLSAVAAVSLANNIITVYQAVFIALGTMISSLFARKLAEQMTDKIQELVNTAVKLTVIISVALGLFSVILGQPISYLLGARGAVLQQATTYLILVGGLIILLGLMTTFGSFLRAKGDTKTPMNASFLANVINLVLSATFIFGFHFGVLGSALGAVLARFIGSVYLYRKLKNERPTRNFFHVKLDRELLHLTFPAAAERLSMRFGDLAIMALIISFGAPIFAGNAIGESITQFNYMSVFGMATVTVILVAQEYGKQNGKNIQKYIKQTYWLASFMMFIVSFAIFAASPLLNRLFTTDKIAAQASTTVILFSLLATFFVAGTTTYTAAFQGVGNARLPFYTTTLGMFGVRLALGALFAYFLHLGLEGVWLGVLLDNLFRFVFLKVKFDQFIKSKLS